MRTFVLLSLLTTLLFSCKNKPKQEVELNYDNKLNYNIFNDSELVDIYTLSDERNSSEIIPYFKSNNPILRSHAVMQFASIKDSLYNDNIIELLEDSIDEVRINAAWALAQTGGSGVFESLRKRLDLENQRDVRIALLEAIGKTIPKDSLSFYRDLILKQGDEKGFSAGIYAMKYRRLSSVHATNTAVEILDSIEDQTTRVYLTQYLSRCDREELFPHKDLIIMGAYHEKDPFVRTGFIGSLGPLGQGIVKKVLNDVLADRNQNGLNEHVAIQALRTYSTVGGLPWRYLQNYLFSENENVALTALSCYEQSSGKPKFSSDALDTLTFSSDRVKTGFIQKNYNKADTGWTNALRTGFEKSENVLNKAHYLRAMGVDSDSYNSLMDIFLDSEAKPLKTASLEAILEILKQTNFPKKKVVEVFNNTMNSGDEGSIALLCYDIRSWDQKPSYLSGNEMFKLSSLKLNLPEDMETYYEILHTDAYLKGEEWEKPDPVFNHPIDWNLTETIPVDQKVKIVTTAGDFIMQLDVENAPGSVTNFVELIQSDFFNDKFFHRVVPNFVIQTGCTRGDGYGSVDFSIRSEFALHRYSQGAVGMASAGEDTESCQWFVTHVPTPFLEGRYSIFAYITEGMDVVNKIGAGDKILSTELIE